ISSPPLSPQTLQPFNSSTQQPVPDSVISLTLEELVAPYVATAPGSGDEMSFKLARAIKPKDLTMHQINQLFHEWFVRSRAFLPVDADENKSLNKFYTQLSRVRYLKTELDLACERALQDPLPFIASLDGNDEAIKVAALCRELQRIAGDRGFICPVNIVQQFLGLRWPAQANWLRQLLERHGVIKCVDRGMPNTLGRKGKPTIWRYKYPAA